MADVTPIRVVVDGSGDTTGLSEFLSGETLGLVHGGTGATTAAGARNSLGLHSIAVTGSWTQLLNKPDTDGIPEGTTNLYYTDARVISYLNTNSYVTQSYVDNAVSNILDGAPGVLDTLNELAAAIGDDANFITTINSSISAVQSNVDALFGSKSTTDLSEGTNLYFTNERVDDRVANLITDGVGITKSYDDAGNLLNIAIDFSEFDSDDIVEGAVNTFLINKTTDDLSEGSTNLYFTNERVDDRVGSLVVGGTNISTTYSDFNNRLTFNLDTTGGIPLTNNSTSDLPEGNNLYYTAARVDARVTYAITAQSIATESFVLSITNPISSNLSSEITRATNAENTISTNLTNEISRATAKENSIQSELDDEVFDRESGDADLQTQINTLTSNAYTGTDFDTDFSAKSTTDLSEGTNLYYTDARVRSHVESQDLDLGSNKVLFANMYSSEANLPSASTYHGMFAHVHGTGKGYFAHAGSWIKLLDESSSTTTDLSEGTNLYYTESRTDARIALQVGSSLDLSNKTTTDLAEGTNLYYTAARDTAQFNTDLATKSTTNLNEGTNLYFTNARVQTKLGDVSGHIIPDTDVSYDLGSSTHKFRDLYLSGSSIILGTIELRDNGGVLEQIPVGGGTTLTYATQAYVTTQIANLVDTAPTTLDTLNELAAALGDDPNFATTVTNSIATKLAITDFTSTADSWLTTKSTSDITEGTNLYYTDARVRNQLYNIATVTTSAGNFYIDGEQQVILTLQPGRTYRFDQSDASNNSHPLRFSEVSDGTHAGGGATAYTTGVTVNGTAGNAGAYVEIVVTNATPRLHYYCANHSGMGGKVGVGKELFVERITSDSWITGPIQTTTVNVGTGGSINATLSTIDFTNSTVVFSGATVNGLSNSDVGLANIADNAQGVVVTGKVAAGSLDIGNSGSINAQLATLDFTNTTVNFGGATIAGLDDTIQDEVDFHLNKNNSGGSTIISDGQVLSWDSTGGAQGTGDYEWIAQSAGHTDTDSLPEGSTNLYYTDARADARVTANTVSIISDLDDEIFDREQADIVLQNQIDSLTVQSLTDVDSVDTVASGDFLLHDGSEYKFVNFVSEVQSYVNAGTGNIQIQTLTDVNSGDTIANGDIMLYDGGSSHFGFINLGSEINSYINSAFSIKSTTDLSEGTNLYYTDARVQTKLGDVSGHILPDTDVTYDLGSSTKKFRDLYLSGSSIILGTLELKDNSGVFETTPVGGGTTETFATESHVATQIANLVDTAPATLDTLNELAAALGDDANFSTTITNSIATKLATADFTSTANTWLTTKSTSDITEGTNLYYTDSRVRTHITGADLDMGSNDITTTGKMLFANMYATTGDLPSATTYHGMFAHVHGTGKGYFAHGGNWVELANNSQIIAQDFSWASITGKPTTIAGYGITDAFDGVFGSLTNTPTTIAGYGITDAFDGTYASLTGTPTIPTSINNLTDVDISTTAPTDGQTLVWDNANSKFIPGAASSSYNDAAVDAHLNQSNPTSGYVLSWNGTDYAWVAQSGGGGAATLQVSDAVPSSPTANDLWLNSTNMKLFVYYADGSSNQWVEVGAGGTISGGSGGGSSVTVSDAAPSSPADGDMWFNSTDTKLYIYYNDGSSSQWVQALPSGGSGSGSSGSSNTWVEKTAAHTVVAGEKLLVDCSSAAVTVTLPAAAALGDEIRIIDATGNSSTNNITIARNGHKIQGAADDLTINTDRAAFGLVYYNAAQGWLLTER